MSVWRAALIVLVLVWSVGCTAAPASPPASDGSARSPAPEEPGRPGAGGQDGAGKLRVVATFSILGDLVQNVAGDRIELYTLVAAGSDTHTFEPSPRDSVALAEAALIFENGLQFERWLDDLYQASGSPARRVVLAEGSRDPLPAMHAGEDGHPQDDAAEAEQDETEGDSHGHGEVDPHVWHDVGNVTRIVGLIRDALAEADPANAETYRDNAGAYLAELRELDEWIVQQVKLVPEENRKLVTSHDTFSYFARRYGFDVIAAALGASTETADPSAGEIAALVEKIRAAGIPAIFAENVQNPGLMERLAAEAGVALAPPLYTDALGEPGSEGDTYLEMMRYNVATIVDALQP